MKDLLTLAGILLAAVLLCLVGTAVAVEMEKRERGWR
jgi:hypothetical protein